MAEKVKIDVELNEKVKETKGYMSEIKKKGGFAKNPGAEQQLKNIIQELESLGKNTNPSIKSIIRMDSLFKQLSEILIKTAGSVGITTKKFRDLQKSLKAQEKQLEDARLGRSNVLKRGRVNKDTGKYELFTSYQDALVAGSGIKNSKGKSIKTVATFLKNFDASGNPNPGAFQDDGAAKKLYTDLKIEQISNANKLAELNAAIDEYKKAIEATKAELAAEGARGAATIASKIVSNKVDFSETADAAKEEIYVAESSKKPTSGVEGSISRNTSSLGKAFKQFTLYNIALRGMKTALREAVQTVKELDKELTEQAMVTGLTREQTYGLVKSYQNLALQVGATTKEIASVATEYVKQGKSIKDSLILTEAAVSAAKVARVSVGDSVNYLTTALNGFQLAASDAMSVSDKFAALAAASATDYDELAIALSKVASQANLAGMSIDYTTALLTKGLETTREAPETMGTALKTIIARMRELSDYGETLEGDTDINNVETQLAYVGIALKNTNGELRSTEDVLDELGKKWDTLNANQQAAVAKALAGTRQQSRLIAVMSDYERVTELQEISARSAGTTAAQASVYLEGIEASLNKITVAWEKIIANLTDSEVIIGGFDAFGNILDNIGDFLGTTAGSVIALTTIANIGLSIIGQKKTEHDLAKLQYKILLKEQILEAKARVEQEKKNALDKTELKNQQLITKQEALQAELRGLDAKNPADQKRIAEIQQEMNDLKLKDSEEYLVAQGHLNSLFAEQNQLLGASYNWLTGISSILLIIKPIQTAILAIQKITNKEKNKEYVATLKQQAAEASGLHKKLLGAGAAMAESAGKIPYVGWIIGIAILAALGVTIGVAAAKQSQYQKSAEGAAEAVNNLSNEIYKLNEKANAIEQITDAYDKLDQKLIKTKKDQEEMNELLDQAADKLSDEEDSWGKGQSEKDFYQSLTGDAAKRNALEKIQKAAEIEEAKKRQEQIDRINKLKGNQRAIALSDSATSSDILSMQSAIYANATEYAYNYADALGENGAAVAEFTSELLNELKVAEALDYVNNPEKISKLVDSFANLKVEIKEINGESKKVLSTDVLGSDSYTISQKVEAYNQMADALKNNKEALLALQTAYSEYEVFSVMGADVLETVESLGLTVEKTNELYDSLFKILQENGVGIGREEYQKLFTKDLLGILSDTGGNISKTIDYVFGSYLTSVETYEAAYNDIVTSFSNIIGVGMLNMGQNIEKLGNTVSSFYEKASKWSDMSESEKTEFMSDNMDLFAGQEGAQLFQAFQSGDYRRIEQALSGNTALSTRLANQIADIDKELSIQMAYSKDKQNQAYIKYLQDWKAKLQDQTNIFKADLELLLKQENEQLDIYKDFLQKQQEELEDSLDKRKEAYEKYFEAINQQQEDEDYQEQSNLLIANLAKLSASTDAASNKQRAELQQQLEDLEKERQQEMRERAQEALIDSIDSTVEEISNKLQKLLDNEQLLLQAMTGDIANGNSFLTSLLASARADGMTNLQLEDYANQIAAAFGSVLDTSSIGEILQQVQNSATINVGNRSFDLNTEDGNALWQVLSAIMLKNGYGN